MSKEFAVELHNVVKQYGSVTAVNHVSIKIHNGEFFSLLGPSGCGKTTTLRLIAGFEIPTSGQVYIEGEPQGYLPAYKRPVNTVFQHYALFPHMTVTKNVSFGLEMKGVPKNNIKQRVAEALELVHLTGMENRRPKQLSGGQQQRVALARALINHPKVLLLDEPLGALDLKLRKEMQVELKALQERVGITFIYVTHDQEEALTMSDRIAVMHQGKLLQVGSAQDVYESPSSRFVSDFIGETNYIDGRLVDIHGGIGEIVVDQDTHIRAHIMQDMQIGQQISVAFRPEKAFLDIGPTKEMNYLPGRIHEVVYTGSASTFLVHVAGNTEVMIRQHNIDAFSATRFKLGDQVFVSWPIAMSKAFAE